MTTYSNLLKDPRWQKVRLKKLEAAEWQCQLCYDTETTLSVHHKRYVKGRQPWEYEDHELVVLCQPCHELEHESKDLRSELISRLAPDGPLSASDFFAVGAGYSGWHGRDDEGLSAVVAQFAQEAPYQVALGAFLAALDTRARLNIGGLQFMTESLASWESEPFVDALLAILAEHGITNQRGLKA